MHETLPLTSGLDGLLADLQAARQADDLGRLALITYCEVRRWARSAGEPELAAQAFGLVTGSPYASRSDFLAQVDALIQALTQCRPQPPRARAAAPSFGLRWSTPAAIA